MKSIIFISFHITPYRIYFPNTRITIPFSYLQFSSKVLLRNLRAIFLMYDIVSKMFNAAVYVLLDVFVYRFLDVPLAVIRRLST